MVLVLLLFVSQSEVSPVSQVTGWKKAVLMTNLDETLSLSHYFSHRSAGTACHELSPWENFPMASHSKPMLSLGNCCGKLLSKHWQPGQSLGGPFHESWGRPRSTDDGYATGNPCWPWFCGTTYPPTDHLPINKTLMGNVRSDVTARNEPPPVYLKQLVMDLTITLKLCAWYH